MKDLTDIELQLQRARSELALVRDRADAGIAAARRYAIADFARDVLPFRDALETALAVETDDVSAMRSGLSIALRQLQAAIARHAQTDSGG